MRSSLHIHLFITLIGCRFFTSAILAAEWEGRWVTESEYQLRLAADTAGREIAALIADAYSEAKISNAVIAARHEFWQTPESAPNFGAVKRTYLQALDEKDNWLVADHVAYLRNPSRHNQQEREAAGLFGLATKITGIQRTRLDNGKVYGPIYDYASAIHKALEDDNRISDEERREILIKYREYRTVRDAAEHFHGELPLSVLYRQPEELLPALILVSYWTAEERNRATELWAAFVPGPTLLESSKRVIATQAGSNTRSVEQIRIAIALEAGKSLPLEQRLPLVTVATSAWNQRDEMKSIASLVAETEDVLNTYNSNDIESAWQDCLETPTARHGEPPYALPMLERLLRELQHSYLPKESAILRFENAYLSSRDQALRKEAVELAGKLLATNDPRAWDQAERLVNVDESDQTWPTVRIRAGVFVKRGDRNGAVNTLAKIDLASLSHYDFVDGIAKLVGTEELHALAQKLAVNRKTDPQIGKLGFLIDRFIKTKDARGLALLLQTAINAPKLEGVGAETLASAYSTGEFADLKGGIAQLLFKLDSMYWISDWAGPKGLPHDLAFEILKISRSSQNSDFRGDSPITNEQKLWAYTVRANNSAWVRSLADIAIELNREGVRFESREILLAGASVKAEALIEDLRATLLGSSREAGDVDRILELSLINPRSASTEALAVAVGGPELLTLLGIRISEEDNIHQGFRYLKRAAEQGYEPALLVAIGCVIDERFQRDIDRFEDTSWINSLLDQYQTADRRSWRPLASAYQRRVSGPANQRTGGQLNFRGRPLPSRSDWTAIIETELKTRETSQTKR